MRLLICKSPSHSQSTLAGDLVDRLVDRLACRCNCRCLLMAFRSLLRSSSSANCAISRPVIAHTGCTSSFGNLCQNSTVWKDIMFKPIFRILLIFLSKRLPICILLRYISCMICRVRWACLQSGMREDF